MRCIWLCKITSALLPSPRTCMPGSLGKQPELDLKTGPRQAELPEDSAQNE
jgi:hypothetical protein